MYYANTKFEMDIADEITYFHSNISIYDQPADAWQWLDALSPDKHDAITALKFNLYVYRYTFNVDHEDEDGPWVLLLDKLKDCGYDEERVEFVRHARMVDPDTPWRENEDALARTEAQVDKLREMLREEEDLED